MAREHTGIRRVTSANQRQTASTRVDAGAANEQRGGGTQLIEPTDAPPSSSWTDPLEGTAFETVTELGEGGFGTCYLAKGRLLDHLVAVKVLHRTAIDGGDARGRFQREAALLVRIQHPNLVRVHAFDLTPRGQPYLVMDYLEGETLSDALSRAGGGPLAVERALDLIAQAGRGLQALHDAGYVHRDVKPGNLFLCADGTLRILDLGLAKVLDFASSLAAMAPRTETGMILGTARYLAPEQARGSRDVDHRADIYALGCVLYRCLTGRGPFDDARGWEEVIAAHVFRQPEPPSTHLKEPLPARLDEVVLRCLTKRREDRFASAAELADALDAAASAIATSDAFGPGFVTQPMCPATAMFEADLHRAPSRAIAIAATQNRVAGTDSRPSWYMFWLVVVMAIVLGSALGALAVALGTN